MTAGCDILPRSPQVRISEATWWIFAIIIANSYTANLAAFLTSSKMEGSITSLKDLSAQKQVKFGTLLGGSTYNLLAESNETVYRLAFNLMNSADPSPFTKDNNQGVERVLTSKGDYMYLMETTTLEYNRVQNCKLRSVGEKFGEKHYAIAVPFGAEYRSNLSVAILRLSEQGGLYNLKQKWWRSTSGECLEEPDPKSTPDLNFDALRGIFYTLYVGIALAYVIGITEFVVYVQEKAAEEGVSVISGLSLPIPPCSCLLLLSLSLAAHLQGVLQEGDELPAARLEQQEACQQRHAHLQPTQHTASLH